MAEVSGLVIGTVALVSLYSTCVQAFDTFQAGKNFLHDYQSACDRFLLLRARLSHWGLVLNVKDPGSEHPALRDHWGEEVDIVGGSLSGIDNALCGISALASKYQSYSLGAGSGEDPAVRQTFCTPQAASVPRKRVLPTSLAILRRRASWAVRDKTRLDKLIGDLTFLIDNLEKLYDRLSLYPEKKELHLRLFPSSQPFTRRLIMNPNTAIQRATCTQDRHEGQEQRPVQQYPQAEQRDKESDQRRVTIHRPDGTREEHFLPSGNEHLITASQRNEAGAVGFMGVLGSVNGATVRNVGPQTNVSSGGFIGIASESAFNSAQRTAAEQRT